MLWSDQMGISNLVGTTYADVTGSKYFCPVNARLREITVVIAGDAATSLIEGIDIRFNSPQWGRDLVVSASGAGIRTAPAVGVQSFKYQCDLPVSASIGIQIQLRNNVTSVTPHISIIGTFESAQ